MDKDCDFHWVMIFLSLSLCRWVLRDPGHGGGVHGLFGRVLLAAGRDGPGDGLHLVRPVHDDGRQRPRHRAGRLR